MGAKLAGASASKFNLGQNSDINVTPFVDVMLVMLIIFMVAAPMATVSIPLNLPPNIGETTDPQTIVSISNDGRPWIMTPGGTRATSRERLIADLTAALGSPRPLEQRVFVRADAHVSYNRFMGVMNQLQDAGFRHVALVSEQL
jgi:biopolymer transport protein ExbD